MNLSNEETVQIISETPYMQYFIDIEKFTSNPVFDSSLFVYIRKRIDVDTFNNLILALMEEEKRREEEAKKKCDGGGGHKLLSIEDIGEINEAESTFETGKRVYNADNVRAKLPDTAEAWTAACFLAKNVMKFLKGLPWLVFEKSKLSSSEDIPDDGQPLSCKAVRGGISIKMKME